MRRLLLTLWLTGAVVYAGTTLLLNDRTGGEGEAGLFSTDELSLSKLVQNTQVLSAAPKVQQSDQRADLEETTPQPIAPGASSDQVTSEIAANRGQAGAVSPSEEGDAEFAVKPIATQSKTEPKILIVTSAANIRSGPSTSAEVIGTAQAGAEVQISRRESGWVHFVDPSSEREGWIYAGLLDPSSGAAGSRETELGGTEELPYANEEAQSDEKQISQTEEKTGKNTSAPQVVNPASNETSSARKEAANAGKKNRSDGPENFSDGESKKSRVVKVAPKTTAEAAQEDLTSEPSPPLTPGKRWRWAETSDLPPDGFVVERRGRGLFGLRKKMRQRSLEPGA